LLSDGCAGVHFNDLSKICLSSNGQHFEFIDQPGKQKRERKYYLLKGVYPASLKKKVHLLVHFNKHLRQQQNGIEKDQETSSKSTPQPQLNEDGSLKLKPPIQEMVYVKRWVRTKHAIMFQLSTRAVQVIFYDESEILLSPSNTHLTYQTQLQRQTMSLDEVGNFPLISKRLNYTNQIFQHILPKSSLSKELEVKTLEKNNVIHHGTVGGSGGGTTATDHSNEHQPRINRQLPQQVRQGGGMNLRSGRAI